MYDKFKQIAYVNLLILRTLHNVIDLVMERNRDNLIKLWLTL